MRVVIKKNLKNWKDCLSFIEFAYNCSVHYTNEFSLFEIVYGFNTLTPIDLILLPADEMVSLDGNRRAQVVKTLHKSVQRQIEKMNHVCATKANKGRKHVVFQLGDWVSVHIHMERFPAQRKSKIHLRGDGPF
jgi:hypothetical protein